MQDLASTPTDAVDTGEPVAARAMAAMSAGVVNPLVSRHVHRDDCGRGHDPTSRHVHRGRQAV
jgi:hypothetical protein